MLENLIKDKLQVLDPIFVELLNESHKHSGSATDSHFKLTLVSREFEQKRPVARHQRIYQLLATELESPIHALALHLYTLDEWQALKAFPASPQCLGGSK